MLRRRNLALILAATALTVASVLAFWVTWERIRDSGNQSAFSIPTAFAQGAGAAQYLSPNQQDDCQYVFTGSGATDEATEPFEITTNEWTVISESDPSGSAPVVTVETADGDLINAPADYNFETGVDTYSVTAEPGTYRLFITQLVDNVNWTVTVDQCGGVDPEQQTDNTQNQSDNAGIPAGGGPTFGPVPLMPNGECPKEFPIKRDGACNLR